MILVASLLLRNAAYLAGIPEGWVSRIFSFELAYFMLGSIAYRAYVVLRKFSDLYSYRIQAYSICAWLCVLILTLTFDRLPMAREVYLYALALCLPGLSWQPVSPSRSIRYLATSLIPFTSCTHSF